MTMMIDQYSSYLTTSDWLVSDLVAQRDAV
jgi:hypothetical protein